MQESGPKPIIILVTGNKGKQAELQQYLTDLATVHAVPVDLPELQAAAVEEVSLRKATEAYHQVRARLGGDTAPKDPALADLACAVRGTRWSVLVDDTSLEFDVLGGLPGIYVKWFLDKLGCAGLVRMTEGFRDDKAEATPGAPPAHRRVTAVSVLTLYTHNPDNTSGSPALQFKGCCRGTLVDAERGDKGFGWDGIFAPERQPGTGAAPYARTYAEFTMEEKAEVSHRGEALRLLREFLLSA